MLAIRCITRPGGYRLPQGRTLYYVFGYILWLSLRTAMAIQVAISVHAMPAAAEPEPAGETQEIPQDQENSAESARSAPTQSVAIRLEETQRLLLTQLKGPPVPIWLSVGDQKVLAFWQPDQSGKPLGAVLMLHAQGQNPRWNTTLLRLHEYLPAHGWATLSVELPDLPPPAIPKRAPPASSPTGSETPAEGTEPQEQTAGSETVPEESVAPPPLPANVKPQNEVAEQIQQRIQAASDYLHQQGQFNLVLLGEGVSAQWALQYLAVAVPPTAPTSADAKRSAVIERAVRALVLLNPQNNSLSDLTDLLQHPDVPTFDVFTDFSLSIRKAADKRRQKARKAGYEHYVQRRLPPMTGATDAEEVLATKAIRGFLQKYAKGEEFQ